MMAVAWEHWSRIRTYDNPVGYLIGVHKALRANQRVEELEAELGLVVGQHDDHRFVLGQAAAHPG